MQDLLGSLQKLPLNPKAYKTLPQGPGIYVFFKDNTPIYIGKAINLKRRVSSYFDLDLAIKTQRMVNSANFLSFIRVDSELESLLLEARLIRKYLPHYNVLAKDDKHPLYIRITKETYPRIITARKTSETEDNLAFFGPFPSSRNVYSVLRMLRRIFPYSDHKLGKRKCIYSHIGLCSPCPNEIEATTDPTQKLESKKQYSQNIKKIKSILEGNIDSVKKDLEKEMQKDSSTQEFERAMQIRDQIQKLEYITKPQIPTEFFMQNPNLYEDVRKNEMSFFKNLLKKSGLDVKNTQRIECFDIAHLAGSNPTASMVTFVDGEAEKSLYRHFKIKTARGGDDVDSMREVAQRRLKNIVAWGRPDLIMVDGGKTQVHAFLEILGGQGIPIIGLAKRFETVVIPQTQNDKLTFLEVRVPTGPILNLVQRIRDEAHRFARRYHHHLISKEYRK